MNQTTERARILVVDDEPLNLEIVARTLARAGFATATAADGREAMDRIDAELFDAVITDVRMPGMTGLDLLRSIRACYPLLPVILMTGEIEGYIAEAASAHGAAALFQKPLNRADLVLTLRLALRESSKFHADCEVVGSV